MIPAFTKIFALGTSYIEDIFDGDVEITEKIDGSQFGFGKINGEIITRSKGRQIFRESVDKMFKKAVEYVYSIEDKLPEGKFFYCEYLQSPRHNILHYGRTPKNNLILFGVSDGISKYENYEKIKEYAEILEIEAIPLVYIGKIDSPEEILKLLEKTSSLGEVEIEGVVVKNYEKQFLLGGQPMPMMAGKFVSEKFKEVHKEKWGSEFTGKGRWVTFVESFRTEARWEKAIQHLKENGELEGSPRDIGNLIKEVNIDITNEEKENIKEFLWNEFGVEVLRKSTHGLPEWYKEKLLKDNYKIKIGE